jgi:AcrR family transcriptional regulator
MTLVKMETRTTPKRNRGGTQPLPLSRPEILRAALPILERDGVDALTVRSVADELGVSSPAVYHYFDGRDDLLDRVCELVAAQVDLTIRAGTGWEDAVVAVLLNMDRTFARYPGVGPRVLHTRQASPVADRISATVHALIVTGGHTPRQADEMLAALQYLFAGWLLGRRADHGRRAGQNQIELERAVRWLLAGARTHPMTHETGS